MAWKRRAASSGGKKTAKKSVGKNRAAVELGRRGGLKGGPARAKALSPARRSAIAKMGAKARWKSRKRG